MGLWTWEEKQENASQWEAPRWSFISILSLQVILCPFQAGDAKETWKKWYYPLVLVPLLLLLLFLSYLCSYLVLWMKGDGNYWTSFGIIQYLIYWQQVYCIPSSWLENTHRLNDLQLNTTGTALGETQESLSKQEVLSTEQQVWDCKIKTVMLICALTDNKK